MNSDPFKHKADNDFGDMVTPPSGNFETFSRLGKSTHNSNDDFKGGSKDLGTAASQDSEESEELQTDSQLNQNSLTSTLNTNTTMCNSNSVPKSQSAHSILNLNDSSQEINISPRKPEGDPNKATKSKARVSRKKSIPKGDVGEGTNNKNTDEISTHHLRNEKINFYRYCNRSIQGKVDSALSRKLREKLGNQFPEIEETSIQNYFEIFKSDKFFRFEAKSTKFPDLGNGLPNKDIPFWILLMVSALIIISDDENYDKDIDEIENSNNIYLKEYCENSNGINKDSIKRKSYRLYLRKTIRKNLVSLCSKSRKLGLKDKFQYIFEKFGFDFEKNRRITMLDKGNRPLEETNNYPHKACFKKVHTITKDHQFDFKEGRQTIKISFNMREQKPTSNTCKIATLQGLNSFSNLKSLTGNSLENEAFINRTTLNNTDSLCEKALSLNSVWKISDVASPMSHPCDTDKDMKSPEVDEWSLIGEIK